MFTYDDFRLWLLYVRGGQEGHHVGVVNIGYGSIGWSG